MWECDPVFILTVVLPSFPLLLQPLFQSVMLVAWSAYLSIVSHRPADSTQDDVSKQSGIVEVKAKSAGTSHSPAES